MAQNKAALKSRIKAINTTKKITVDMEIISSAKLKKFSNPVDKNREYSQKLTAAAADVLASELNFEHLYLKNNSQGKKAYVYFGSDMGLCGGYNNNLTKFAKTIVNADDYLYCIGTNQYSMLKRMGFNVINDECSSDDLDFLSLKKIADQLIDRYAKGEISSISLIYTRFINNVTFEPHVIKVLPADHLEASTPKDIYLEPKPTEVIDYLIPMLVRNDIYGKWLESKASEQGSRRFAMENATDNANDLVDKLTLAYNQARQAAITQEITEIVGGADAL